MSEILTDHESRAMTGQAEIGGGRRAGRWRIALWGGAALLLLLPAVAMRFTGEVDWGPADFLTMGVMLAAACGTFELSARATGSRAHRAAVALAVAAAFLLVWVNLAVGMIGSERNPYNLLFAGVIAVALLGSALARFRPAGMARAMLAAAIAQGLIAAGGLSADLRGGVLSGVLAGLWLLAAWLFRRAARAPACAGATPAR